MPCALALFVVRERLPPSGLASVPLAEVEDPFGSARVAPPLLIVRGNPSLRNSS